MVINAKISLCKITAASKLFQRNYYLPLLKPLSPKDALRRKIITGQNVLGRRIEHYIPVLTTHNEKTAERRRRGKGVPIIKKRLKKSNKERYVEPFLDDDIENHIVLKEVLAKKPRGKGQRYTYEVFDKKCTLVITAQMEKAIKDRDIIDVTMAQRSEKILVKLNNGLRVTVPIASYNGDYPLYRGSGWTKETVEEEHHHGKETMSIAKLFEAKEQGVAEWELEMMRLANKRKKKVKGQDSVDWKQMVSQCLENMDWDKFEEETKQIVEEAEQTVEEENIPMAVDDFEKTKNVAEKLKQGGEEVLKQLPIMTEIPAVIKNLESGEMCELQDVSGVRVDLTEDRSCFVTGQMVKTDENEVFVPGQTIINDSGVQEYTPGITIYMDNEPTLIPGLVMGEEEQPAMFLPGESTITEEGQLKFEATNDDLPIERRQPSPSTTTTSSSSPSPTPTPTPSPSPSPSPIQSRSLSPSPPPPPPRPKIQPKQEEEIIIRRRVIAEPEMETTTTRKEHRVKKRTKVEVKKSKSPTKDVFRPQRQPMEDPLKLFEEEQRRQEEMERKRQKERHEEKLLKEETKVDRIRMSIRKKCRELVIEKPAPYVPVEPVKKSPKLEELEMSIKQGTFFENDRAKEILEKAKHSTRMLKYQHILNAYGSEFGMRRF